MNPGGDVTTFQAIVLGIVQGLGEFLPISSSAHLVVTPWLLGWPDPGLAFDVALHVGTLAAVLYAFAGDWARIIMAAFQGLFRGRPFEGDARMLWLLALASVPGGVAGLALEDYADTTFRSPLLIAATMAGVGTVLLLADRRAARLADGAGTHDALHVTTRDALLIGCAQALAIVPGVSRSGSTISMALFLGYRREEAARFSFLLATPITLGAALHKVPHLLGASSGHIVLLGIVVSAVVGLLAIRVLLAYVRTRDYRPFVYYRWAFAAMLVVVYLVRQARVG
ncbi:MAG TPA: undecaprenyl-diphosphate phosphatase [Vicinamibacteria bacterium]|nr:undecaprenyl-diphosphate phosphatase [Vicinamibacteria bacterium]